MNNQLITKFNNTDDYLIKFLDIDSIINYSLLSKDTNKLINSYSIYKLLILYKKQSKEKDYNELINWAAKNGHVNVLEWFKNSGLEFKYTDNAIDWAAQNGHVNVLEWFKNSGLEFKYTDDAIDWAA